MQEIADWLEKLGMSEYTQRFVENRIDITVLPELTDQDLKDIGVVLGDRRKILRAIASLKSTETASPKLATEAEIARPQDTAERRQVTVLFSDLVGSTALSARMDPEDLREVISAYQKCVAETVQRFGGFVAKYMGWGPGVFRVSDFALSIYSRPLIDGPLMRRGVLGQRRLLELVGRDVSLNL
jgi:hypothetical protein